MSILKLHQSIGNGHVTCLTENFATIEVNEPLKAKHYQELRDEYGFELLTPPVIGKEFGINSGDVFVYTFHK